MKIWKVAIIHLIGAILLTLTTYALGNSYVYSSFPFLQSIVEGPYFVIVLCLIGTAICFSVGLFTAFNVNFKKDKFHLIKKILVFVGSVIVLNVIFRVIFVLSWAILIDIYGY